MKYNTKTDAHCMYVASTYDLNKLLAEKSLSRWTACRTELSNLNSDCQLPICHNIPTAYKQSQFLIVN